MNIAAIGFLVLAGMLGGMNYFLRIKPRQNAEYRAYINRLSNDAMEMKRKEEKKKLNELLGKIEESNKEVLQRDEAMRQARERDIVTKKMTQELEDMKSRIDDLRTIHPGRVIKIPPETKYK